MSSKFAALEIDLNSGSGISTFRIWSGRESLRGLSRKVGLEIYGFELGLQVPFTVGIALSIGQYGTVLRGSFNGSNIEFLVNQQTIGFVNNFNWMGSEIRIYEGKDNDEFDDMEIVFIGRVVNLQHDYITNIATLQINDKSVELNKPLITNLYQRVSGILDVENLTGVLSKEISGTTTLTPIECTSPGIILTGSVTYGTVVYFVGDFRGLVQVSNQTSGGVAVTIGLVSGGNTISLTSGEGEILYADGSGFRIADGSPEETEQDSLLGLPKPRLWGEVNSIEPVLEIDDLIRIYRISTQALNEVTKFSVGGIEDWDKVVGDPGNGQWSEDIASGTIKLKSVTFGSEILCNVRAAGYGSLTTGELVRQIAEEKNLTVDVDSLSSLNINLPYLVGYYRTNVAINTLDAVDEIISSMGCWWTLGFVGEIQAGVIKSPAIVDDGITLDETNIVTFAINSLIPPAWRIRVQYARNFKPLQNPLAGVTEAEKLLLTAEGLNVDPYNNSQILNLNPLAVDVAMVKSLVLIQTNAEGIRNRLADAYGIERRIYDVTYFSDMVPEIFNTIKVSFQGIEKNFIVNSILRSVGGGNHTLQIWG